MASPSHLQTMGFSGFGLQHPLCTEKVGLGLISLQRIIDTMESLNWTSSRVLSSVHSPFSIAKRTFHKCLVLKLTLERTVVRFLEAMFIYFTGEE
jgi:hypothetical protein